MAERLFGVIPRRATTSDPLPRAPLAMLCVVLGLTGVLMAIGLQRVDQQSEGELESRFQLRVELAERFLHAYVQDLLERERTLGQRELGAATVREDDFTRMVHAFGFQAAVLVGSTGELLQVSPSRPELVGSPVATRYPHLQSALRNGACVSPVVASAAKQDPVVGFAVRFQTELGPRVFSGAYDVTTTPLRAYISNVLALKTAIADLVDDRGVVVASSRDALIRGRSLADVDPALQISAKPTDHGVYRRAARVRMFATRQVRGTPWRLLGSVDQDVFFAPVRDARGALPWVVYAAFCVAVFTAFIFLHGLLAGKRQLHQLNIELERLARVDRLTGLPNRHHLEEQLSRLASAARRHRSPLSVLIIDVDHFKSVNDAFGHGAGDTVLTTLAARMAAAVRVEDTIGRWGGEEFLALLPNTDERASLQIAERIRAAACSSPIQLADQRTLEITASIGCATTLGSVEGLLARADKALYSAKNAGRDRVVGSDPAPAAETA